MSKQHHNLCGPGANVPAAACNFCGGWTGFGGMSGHRDATEPVQGRTGCTCNKSKKEEVK